MTIYNKLVRDKIPSIIQDRDQTCETHIAEDAEFHQKLFEKLEEEVRELIMNENKEEMADVLEVLYTICALKGFSMEEVELFRKKKREERGGFDGRVILDSSSFE